MRRKNITTFIHPDFQDIFYLSVNTLFKGNACEPFELHLSLQNKQLLIVRVDGYLTQHTDDTPVVLLSFTDITKQKEKQQQIRFQADLLNSVGESIIATDNQGIIIYWNKPAESIYGWKASEAIGKNIVNVTPTTTSREEAKEIMEQLKKGKRWQGEFDVQDKDGRIFPVQVIDDPILDEKGDLIGTIRVSMDISERRETEKLLQEKSEEISAQNEELAVQNEELAAQNEEYLTLNESLKESIAKESLLGDIIRNSSVAVGIEYPDGTLGLTNKAFNTLIGYTEKEIQKLDWVKDLTPLEFFEKERDALKKLHQTKEPVVYEKEIIRKNGSRVPIELVVHPRLDARGNIECYFFFITDITERKKAAEKLIREKERSQQYLDIAGVMILALDVNGIITLANKKAAQILGYKQNEILGKQWIKTFIPSKNQKTVNALFKEIISGKITPNEKTEGLVQTKSGEERIIKWYNRIIYDHQGNIRGTLSSGEDVTEKRKIEAEL